MIGYFLFFCKQKTAYEMRISDWSSDVCSSDLLNLCMDLPASDNQFCDRITRDARGYAEVVDTSYMNVSESEATGIDVGAHYRTDVGPGRLAVAVRASYLIKFETTTLPGVDTSRIIYDGGYQDRKSTRLNSSH